MVQIRGNNINIVFEDEFSRVIHGDCTDSDTMSNDLYSLIIADSPYNLQIRDDVGRRKQLLRHNGDVYQGVEDEWDTFGSLAEYLDFVSRWIASCRKALTPNGQIWTCGTYHNIYFVGAELLNQGYWIRSSVPWIKLNPTPSFAGVRLTPAHELWINAQKDKKSKRVTFNYQLLKSLNNGKQMRDDQLLIGSTCTGRDRLRNDDGGKLHTTQKPEYLIERILYCSGNGDDHVLDPFGGTGTTAAVCRKMGIRCTTIEKSDEYIPYIVRRLQSITPGNPRDVDMMVATAKATAKATATNPTRYIQTHIDDFLK